MAGPRRWPLIQEREVSSDEGASCSSCPTPSALAGLAQISRLHPEHSAIATGARAESLHGSDIDVCLREFGSDLGDSPWPIFALDQEPALLLA